jgi:short-subunit dehydrogenase
VTDLQGVQTALITGAASGIGQLMTLRLARTGVRVVAVDKDEEGLARLVAEQPTVVGVPLDVSDSEAVVATVGPWADSLDLVVVAAAVGYTGRIEETSVETFRRLMEVNYLGTVATVKAVLPAMRSRDDGHLVIFGSMAGWVPAPLHSAYSATKAAVVMHAEIVRQELRGTGVKLTCVCPPSVATPLLDAMPASRATTERVKPLSTDQVVDAVESAVRHNRFWVFPDLTSKAVWRMRRLAPGPLAWATSAALLARPVQAQVRVGELVPRQPTSQQRAGHPVVVGRQPG